MGKLLKVLTVIFLLLSAGALALGILLFAKRELLKGRTQKLENAVIAVGTTIEAEAPRAGARPDLPAKDTSPCRAEVLDTPEISTFWDSYSNALEQVDQPTLDLSRRKAELMQYYKMNPVTQKVDRDPVTGAPMTSGEGTMQAVINDLLAKAGEQHSRLNATRLQLKNLRNELVDTITEFNQLKRQLRTSLVTIEDQKKTIERLNGEIATLKQQVRDLERERDELNGQIADQKKQIALLEEEKVEKDAQIDQLKKEVDKLRLATPVSGPTSGAEAVSTQAAVQQIAAKVEPGNKGKIIAVDGAWNFAVIELTESFMKEILGDDLSGGVPPLELLVKRSGEAESPDQFVTKIRLLQIKKAERLAIADVLSDWTQMPPKEGDVVFH